MGPAEIAGAINAAQPGLAIATAAVGAAGAGLIAKGNKDKKKGR